jgi:hypothetical protein
LFAAALVAGLAGPLSADAASIAFRSELKGTNVVPPTGSHAEGILRATFDTQTRKLSWSGSHSGLSSKIRFIAFHGPASPNEAGSVVQRIRSLSEGSATLSEAEAADLIGGYWNITIHTRELPGGEIRGQMVRGE